MPSSSSSSSLSLHRSSSSNATLRQQSAQQQHPTTTTTTRRRNNNTPVGIYLLGSVMIMLIICNIIVIQTKLSSWEKDMERIRPPYHRYLPSNNNNHNNPFSEEGEYQQQSQTTTTLQQRQQQYQMEQQQQQYSQPGLLFYAFTIRDSVRLNGNPPLPRKMHIFDYVDVSSSKQTSGKQKLYLDGYYQGEIPCQEYSINCYSKKIIQTFTNVLQQQHNSSSWSSASSSVYYFYMESDNDLCVPIEEIRDLAFKEQRYFISTGIGASGWIMSSKFMKDFILDYQMKPKNTTSHHLQPDVHASQILMKSKSSTQQPSWSVTRQYLVQHTLAISPSTSHQGLTLDTYNLLKDKHLPRCFEPHRGLWPIDNLTFANYDIFGWDYFDYDKCPTSFIFPCGNNQIPLALNDIEKPSPLKFVARYQNYKKQRQQQQQLHQQPHDMSLQKLQRLGFVRGAGVGVTARGSIGGKDITGY